MKHRTVQGFTLIELMIVVVIMAILAVIAWPSYQSFVHKTHLEDARADLLENAQTLEKFYSKNHTFTGAPALTNTKSGNFYSIQFYPTVANPAGDTYQIAAVPTDGTNDYLLYNDKNEMLMCTLSGTTPANADDCQAY